jgi:hypothetical protein
MAGSGLTSRERIFVAMAWTPKATVQAALAAAPLDAIINAKGPGSPDVAYGEAILTTSVFAILICAPLGVTLIHYFAPHLLEKMEVGLKRGSAGGGGGGGAGQPADVEPSRAAAGPDGRRPGSKAGGAAQQLAGAGVSPPGAAALRAAGKEAAAAARLAASPLKQRHAAAGASPFGAAAVVDVEAAAGAEGAAAAAAPAGGSGGRVAEVLQQALEQRALEASDSTLGRYLASMEQLAAAVEQAGGGAAGCEAAQQMHALVVSLRRKLLADAHLMADSEEGLAGAKAFFKLAQSVQTLPEVGAALESLPQFYGGGSAGRGQ